MIPTFAASKFCTVRTAFMIILLWLSRGARRILLLVLEAGVLALTLDRRNLSGGSSRDGGLLAIDFQYERFLDNGESQSEASSGRAVLLEQSRLNCIPTIRNRIKKDLGRDPVMEGIESNGASGRDTINTDAIIIVEASSSVELPNCNG